MFAVVPPVKTCSRDGDLLLLWCPPSPLVKVKHVVNVTTLVTVVPLVQSPSQSNVGPMLYPYYSAFSFLFHVHVNAYYENLIMAL